MAEGFGLGLEAFRGFERPQKRTQCMYLGKSKSPMAVWPLSGRDHMSENGRSCSSRETQSSHFGTFGGHTEYEAPKLRLQLGRNLSDGQNFFLRTPKLLSTTQPIEPMLQELLFHRQSKRRVSCLLVRPSGGSKAFLSRHLLAFGHLVRRKCIHWCFQGSTSFVDS